MGLSDLNENSLCRALLQFRELGRNAFLERYSFRKARTYFVEHDGLLYEFQSGCGCGPWLLAEYAAPWARRFQWR